MPITTPQYKPAAFGYNAPYAAYPTLATGTHRVSLQTGFPPLTRTPVASGGIPPSGDDFNTVLRDITEHTVYQTGGLQYKFDAAFAAAVGGYPVGAVLQNNAGTASYRSAVAANAIDFNTSPASIGTAWIPYAGGALASVSVVTTGGVTTLTTTQASADIIIVSGALTSNATLTFPARIGRWNVINNTSGSFALTAMAQGGSGVLIFQGGSDFVYSDSFNMRYSQSSTPTRSPGDSTQHQANTEFVTLAVNLAVSNAVSQLSISNRFIYFMGQH